MNRSVQSALQSSARKLRLRSFSAAAAAAASPPAPMPVDALENLASVSLNEDQVAFRELARDFSLAELQPYAAQWDRESHFPVDTLRAAAQLGFGDSSRLDAPQPVAYLVRSAVAAGTRTKLFRRVNALDRGQ